MLIDMDALMAQLEVRYRNNDAKSFPYRSSPSQYHAK